jgi:effector-binding domain-containing protein
VVNGPYNQIPAHYAEFLAWATVESVMIADSPREVYVVHPKPGTLGDSTTVTELQFPVAAEG